MFMATTASAAPAQFKTVTHLANRQDTCACTTNMPSPNGDVWAIDNLSRQFTVTNNHDGTYSVVATDNGSFAATSQPNDTADLTTNHPIDVTGTIQGTIAFTVTASQAPSGLPSQTPGNVSTTSMIQNMFGDISSSAVQMTSYSYTYTAGAQVYSQTWNNTTNQNGTITGNIA